MNFLIDPTIQMTEYYYNTLKGNVLDINDKVVPVFDFVPTDFDGTRYVLIDDQYIDENVINNVDKQSFANQFVQVIKVVVKTGLMTGGKYEIQHINKQIVEKIITHDTLYFDDFDVIKTVLDNLYTTSFEDVDGVIYVTMLRFTSDVYQK